MTIYLIIGIIVSGLRTFLAHMIYRDAKKYGLSKHEEFVALIDALMASGIIYVVLFYIMVFITTALTWPMQIFPLVNKAIHSK